jgi:nucleoside-diphosphate-sugar epimerase
MKSDINGERYILSSENLTYRNVFDMVAEALGKQKPTVEGTQFLTELAWRADWVKSKLLRLGKLTFSKENIRVSRSVARFDNAKIKNAIDFEFEPIQSVVDRIADYYTDKRYDRDL